MTTKYEVKVFGDERDPIFRTWGVGEVNSTSGACFFVLSRLEAEAVADILNTLQAKADRLDAAEKKLKTLIDDFTPKITWDCGVLSGLRIASDVLKEPNHD